MQTVVELPEFQKRAKVVMSDPERNAAINFIAANPEAGVALGGGLRKIRIPHSAFHAMAVGRVAGSEQYTFLAARICRSF